MPWYLCVLWIRILSNCRLCRTLGATISPVIRAAKWVADRLFQSVEFIVPWTEFTFYLGCRITTLKEQTTILFDQLSELLVPTLIIWGAKDRILPVKQAYAAAEAIPDCEIKIFGDCGHSVYQDESDEFSSVVAKFLD